MAITMRVNRLVPDSVVIVAVVAALLVGLTALCCCFGENAAAHVAGRSVGASAVAADSPPGMRSDLRTTIDPADPEARRPGDGCGHPAGDPASVRASGGAGTRDLPAGATIDVYRPLPAPRLPTGTVGGVAARAPASHLLCIMRT